MYASRLRRAISPPSRAAAPRSNFDRDLVARAPCAPRRTPRQCPPTRSSSDPVFAAEDRAREARQASSRARLSNSSPFRSRALRFGLCSNAPQSLFALPTVQMLSGRPPRARKRRCDGARKPAAHQAHGEATAGRWPRWRPREGRAFVESPSNGYRRRTLVRLSRCRRDAATVASSRPQMRGTLVKVPRAGAHRSSSPARFRGLAVVPELSPSSVRHSNGFDGMASLSESGVGIELPGSRFELSRARSRRCSGTASTGSFAIPQHPHTRTERLGWVTHSPWLLQRADAQKLYEASKGTLGGFDAQPACFVVQGRRSIPAPASSAATRAPLTRRAREEVGLEHRRSDLLFPSPLAARNLRRPVHPPEA